MGFQGNLRWVAVLIGLILIAFSISCNVGEEAERIAIDKVDEPADINNPEKLSFTVSAGESADEIGRRLEKRGLIKNAVNFKLLVAYYDVDKELEAGDYELSPSMTVTEIIGKLRHGTPKPVVVIIPEGWRAEQIADKLAEEGIVSSDAFLTACKKVGYSYGFLNSKPASSNLEGYLFPDTYHIPPKFDAESLVELMLQNFGDKVTEKMRKDASNQGLSLHQLLTLASIVEREAVLPQERALIAGVFVNRLKMGMLLDADPTVQYALGNDPDSAAKYGYWKSPLTVSDLRVDSAYNTYRYVGLPPGPICNPGLASIKAVLNPEKTDYLYFVAKEDRSHVFAATLEEHSLNVSKYRR